MFTHVHSISLSLFLSPLSSFSLYLCLSISVSTVCAAENSHRAKVSVYPSSHILPDVCCTWMFWGSSYVPVASIIIYIHIQRPQCLYSGSDGRLTFGSYLFVFLAAAATDWEGAQGRVGHDGGQPQGHSPESSPTFLQQSGRWGSPWYFQEIAFLFHLMFDHLFNHHSTVSQYKVFSWFW